jgi:hypothetical protein
VYIGPDGPDEFSLILSGSLRPDPLLDRLTVGTCPDLPETQFIRKKLDRSNSGIL